MADASSHSEHQYRHMVKGPKPHVHSVWVYWGVFGLLVALTGLTVYLAQPGFDFGSFSVALTLFIAGTKATLVLAVFMHLYFDNKFFALIIGVSLVFLALFVIFPIIDLGSREMVSPTRGNFGPRNEAVYAHEHEVQKSCEEKCIKKCPTATENCVANCGDESSCILGCYPPACVKKCGVDCGHHESDPAKALRPGQPLKPKGARDKPSLILEGAGEH